MGTIQKHTIGYRLLAAIGATLLVAALVSAINIASATAQSTIPISVQAQVVGGSATVSQVGITLQGNGTDISATGATGITGVQVTPGATYSLTSTIGASGYTSQWVCKSGVTVSGGSVTIPSGLSEVECTVYHAAATRVPINVTVNVVNDGAGTAGPGDFDLELFDSSGAFLDSGMASSGTWSTAAPAGSYLIGISGLGTYTVDSASCQAVSSGSNGEDEALQGTSFTIAADTGVVNCAVTVNDPEVPATAVPTATTVPPTATSVPATATPVPPTATSVPPTAVPATAVPATAVPATAVPATAVPATAVPATAVPATAAPATAVPATAVPASTDNSGASNSGGSSSGGTTTGGTTTGNTTTNTGTSSGGSTSGGSTSGNLSTDAAPAALAFTGAETVWFAAAGTILLALGMFLSTTATRRRES